MSPTLQDARDHPTLSHIDRRLLNRTINLIGDTNLAYQSTLDAFPAMNTIVPNPAVINVAEVMADATGSGIEVVPVHDTEYETYVGSIRVQSLFTGIMLQSTLVDDDGELELSCRLSHSKTHTLAPDAPAGAPAMLACAAALLRHIDELTQRTDRLQSLIDAQES